MKKDKFFIVCRTNINWDNREYFNFQLLRSKATVEASYGARDTRLGRNSLLSRMVYIPDDEKDHKDVERNRYLLPPAR